MTKMNIAKNILFVTICLLSACDSTKKEKTGSQVVAKVNSNEISIHQLNFVLARTPGVTQENAEAVKKKLLTNLVDLEILYQQALSEKYDRDPDIMMALEQSKHKLLGEAWLQKASNDNYKPTSDEIKVYYDDTPDLFAKHKTFKLKQVVISKDDVKPDVMNGLMMMSKKVDELTKKLDEAKIPFQASQMVQGAENIQIDQLPTLSSMKDGDFLAMQKDNSYLVLAMMGYIEESIPIEKASSVIERYLINKHHSETIAKTMKDTRLKYRVEYIGQFSSLNSPTIQ